MIDRWKLLVKYESLIEKPALIAEDPHGFYSLILDEDGNPWVLNDSTVNIWKDQKWTSSTTLAGTNLNSYYANQLLKGSGGKMYVDQSIYYYNQDVVTIFEMERPVSNHYIDYELTGNLGIDGKGNLWFGGFANLVARKNSSDGSFNYFELFQFPLADFEKGTKLISGNGEEIFIKTFSGKLIHFNGHDWKEIKEVGSGIKIKDAAVSDNNQLYALTENSNFADGIYVYDFNTDDWTKIDLNPQGVRYIYSIKKGINGSIWVEADENIVKINPDNSVKVYIIPDHNSISHRIGFDVNSSGIVQFYGERNIAKDSLPIYHFDSNAETWKRYIVTTKLGLDLFMAFDMNQVFSIIDSKNRIWLVYSLFQSITPSILVIWNFEGTDWNNVFRGRIGDFEMITGVL
jgi:hypothetical protein